MYIFALFPGDSAVLLLVLVLGFFVVLGMIADGVRMALLLVASVVSYFVAPLLGQFVPPSFLPENPIWREAGVADIFAFVILMVLFFVGIHFLHRWLEIELKYKWTTRKHKEWGRVNSVIGLCLGGVMGVFYFLAMAGLITPVGYATAQMPAAQPDADPIGYRLAGRLYRDFRTPGVDRMASAFNPATTNYYAGIDVAGLVYNNIGTTNLLHVHQFRARLMGYPGLVDAAYNPHMRQLTAGDFIYGIYVRTNLTHLLVNPSFQSAYGDPELRAQLAQVDMNHLRNYLLDTKTVSDQFNLATLTQQGLPPILGRWTLDVDNTLQQFQTEFPNMDDRAKRDLKTYIEAIGDQMSLSFSTGNYYLEAKYFHSKAMARKANNFIPRTPSITIRIIQQTKPRLLLSGPWNVKADKSGYEAVFLLGPQNNEADSKCLVSIVNGPTQIILILEGFHSEPYVFRRQKF